MKYITIALVGVLILVPFVSKASTIVNGITCATGGDANSDGIVDGSDYALIDNGFNQFTAGNISHPTLIDGDFNGDGVIDGADYAIIDANFAVPALYDCPIAPPVEPIPASGGYGIVSGGGFILSAGTVLSSPYTKYILTVNGNGGFTETLNPDFKN